MSRINTNVSSLFAQKTLGRTNDQLNTAMSRLSSGLRINSAADDPAGLIASEVLRSDMTAVSQAITNTDRANQLIQTADSALGEVSNLLNDIRGLVVEAANDGALSAEQIAANQLQVDSSLEAIDRIARTTSFGGKKLLDGALDIRVTNNDVDITDVDVQQVNLGSSSTAGTLFDSMTVNANISSAATQGTLTDGSDAVGQFTFGNASNEFTISVFAVDGNPAIDNVTLDVRYADNTGTVNSVLPNQTQATFDAGTNKITLNIHTGTNVTAANTSAEIIQAINSMSQFENTAITGGTQIRADNTAANALHFNGQVAGGTATDMTDQTNVVNRVQDRVVKISGNLGSETFTFATGTTQTVMSTAINAVADATGVTATVNGSNELVLTASDFGSDGFVDVEVISETAIGTYAESGTGSIGRSTGTNVAGTINGIAGSGKGNVLSVRSNILTADVTMLNTAALGTDHTFTITGGGANFQLGSDVVTPQQARIGIASVDSGKLGGTTGSLFQLKSGQNAALATDSITAGKIVDEAILSVANTRGRLGAFSATTLDSNKTALSDYLVNLTEAESSLRDADFAKESAALTRAQVLVQSGTSILAIANQNPQNMLALIR